MVQLVEVLLVVIVALASSELRGGDPETRLTAGGVLTGEVVVLVVDIIVDLVVADLAAASGELAGTSGKLG